MDASVIATWTCEPCSHSTISSSIDPKVFQNTQNGGQGFVTYNTASNLIVVAFRGSSNLDNWLTDFTIEQIPWAQSGCSGCEVHEGFADMWTSFRTIVYDHVEAFRATYPTAPILVTGHSLGAAVATLAALDLKINYTSSVSLYNFGSPRVGNYDFYTYFKSIFGLDVYRITHELDPVPHTPMEIQGFHHIATEVWYYSATDPQTFKVCNGSGEDSTCADSVVGDVTEDHLVYLGWSTDCNNNYTGNVD